MIYTCLVYTLKELSSNNFGQYKPWTLGGVFSILILIQCVRMNLRSIMGTMHLLSGQPSLLGLDRDFFDMFTYPILVAQ